MGTAFSPLSLLLVYSLVSLMQDSVVFLSFSLIRQHLVGFGNLLKDNRRLFFISKIPIRMVLHGQPPIGFLNVCECCGIAVL